MITGGALVARLDLAQQVEAVAVGHQDVAEHEVEGCRARGARGPPRPSGRCHVVALALEEQGEEIDAGSTRRRRSAGGARAHAGASADTRVTLGAGGRQLDGDGGAGAGRGCRRAAGRRGPARSGRRSPCRCPVPPSKKDWKGWKRLVRCSSDMPRPVSITSERYQSPASWPHDPQGAAVGHGPQGVAGQVPEDLAHLVADRRTAGPRAGSRLTSSRWRRRPPRCS